MDKNDNYNRYFHIWHVKSNIFIQWFCMSSSTFTSALVSRNFREYGSTVYFRVQIWIWKKFSFVFCENGKSGKKILSHCLNNRYLKFNKHMLSSIGTALAIKINAQDEIKKSQPRAVRHLSVSLSQKNMFISKELCNMDFHEVLYIYCSEKKYFQKRKRKFITLIFFLEVNLRNQHVNKLLGDKNGR